MQSLFRDRDFRLVAGSVGLSALVGIVGLLALLRLKREAAGTETA